MTNSEHVAYIRGLFEGLDVDADKQEGRILKEIINVLEAISHSIAELEEENESLQETVDVMIEDVYDDDNSEDETDSDNAKLFEVVCPSCGEQVFVDNVRPIGGKPN